jgi:transposase-like protein
MPTHAKKKCTTANTTDSTPGQTAPALPDEDEFRQHLRELARGAVRLVLEDVMREELDALIGVGWGESSPKRKGYRNGSYTRDLVTTSGRIEDLQVPRDREGKFRTQVFERYRRYEPQVAQGLTDMFVAGTSTHKVGEVAQMLLGVAPSVLFSVIDTGQVLHLVSNKQTVLKLPFDFSGLLHLLVESFFCK